MFQYHVGVNTVGGVTAVTRRYCKLMHWSRKQGDKAHINLRSFSGSGIDTDSFLEPAAAVLLFSSSPTRHSSVQTCVRRQVAV